MCFCSTFNIWLMCDTDGVKASSPRRLICVTVREFHLACWSVITAKFWMRWRNCSVWSLAPTFTVLSFWAACSELHCRLQTADRRCGRSVVRRVKGRSVLHVTPAATAAAAAAAAVVALDAIFIKRHEAVVLTESAHICGTEHPAVYFTLHSTSQGFMSPSSCHLLTWVLQWKGALPNITWLKE